MTNQRVQPDFEITKVPEPNRLVCRTSGEQVLGCWAERKRVDRVSMTVGCLHRCRGCGWVSYIQDLQSEIIRHTSDQRRMQWMMLHVIDDGTVVCVRSRSMECFVRGREFSNVPALFSIRCLFSRRDAHHSRTVSSSLPVARWPASCGLQLSPKPSIVCPISSISGET